MPEFKLVVDQKDKTHNGYIEVKFDNGWSAVIGFSFFANHLVGNARHDDGLRKVTDRLIDPDGIGDFLNEIKAMDAKPPRQDPMDRIIAAVRAEHNGKVVTAARIDNLKAERDSLMESYCRAEESTQDDDNPALVGLRGKIAEVNRELAAIESGNVAAYLAARQPD